MFHAMKILVVLASLSVLGMCARRLETFPTKSIYVVMLARNKEHILKYFFDSFENLSYPKKKMSLFIRSDHNSDATNEVIRSWLTNVAAQYQSVNVTLEEGSPAYDEEMEYGESWGFERNANLILLKEQGLSEARYTGADYVLFLDVDAFLLDPDVLQKLIKEDKTIVAPMLTSIGTYSTFWGAMTTTFWYKRSNDYLDIVNYKMKECFPVPLVSGAVLVNLQDEVTQKLSFYQHRLPGLDTPGVPMVDIILFSLSAHRNGLDVYVTNREKYGHILLPTDDKEASRRGEVEQIRSLKITNFSTNSERFDKSFCISSLGKSSGRKEMNAKLQKLGFAPTFIDSFSSHDLNVTFAKSLNIKPLQEYTKRHPLTYGDVGHFLSHYFVWKKVLENNYSKVLVLEEDVTLEDNFNWSVNSATSDLRKAGLEWDFVYLSRGLLGPQDDAKIPGSDLIVRPSYYHHAPDSGYLLSLRGATKLVNADPLTKLLPLHDYLSIMFNKHPQTTWKQHFVPRDLRAFALSPGVVTAGRRHTSREAQAVENDGDNLELDLRDLAQLYEEDVKAPVLHSSKDNFHPLKTEL